MNDCMLCKYYDVSVGACNADDICYVDGYEKGKKETLMKVKDILKFTEFGSKEEANFAIKIYNMIEDKLG